MINKAKDIFHEYASHYDCENGKIKLKIIHTMAVADVMEELTRLCQLPEKIRDLAGVCAVFHDIGRFEQVTQYDTFLDHLSRDHADLGCEVLVSEHFLEFLPEREQKQVLTAIRNHNKFQIEEGLDEETLLLCKLIRDADKCDIFRVFACEDMVDTMGETYEQVAEETVTDEVYDTIFRHETVLKTIRKTGLDIWIGFLAFFFDLYFDESIRILQKQKYYLQPFERITFTLPETRKKVQEIREEVENYIASRL
ncbi:MAG: HD domain-containing protein [Lachnospiraceae bacterium]|nr:HD domain-containing protein [Lachnospiraceae bacterium]